MGKRKWALARFFRRSWWSSAGDQNAPKRIDVTPLHRRSCSFFRRMSTADCPRTFHSNSRRCRRQHRAQRHRVQPVRQWYVPLGRVAPLADWEIYNSTCLSCRAARLLETRFTFLYARVGDSAWHPGRPPREYILPFPTHSEATALQGSSSRTRMACSTSCRQNRPIAVTAGSHVGNSVSDIIPASKRAVGLSTFFTHSIGSLRDYLAMVDSNALPNLTFQM